MKNNQRDIQKFDYIDDFNSTRLEKHLTGYRLSPFILKLVFILT